MRLPFNGRYLVLGVLIYIIVLILNFPAERAYAYWKNSDKASRSLSLGGISGSVWSGRADFGNIQGQSLENIEWRLRPWSLLLGQVGLSWSVSLSNPGGVKGHGNGVTSMGLDGSIDFSSLEARIPASVTAEMAGMAALRPSGIVTLNLQDVEWNGQNLESAKGQVVWSSAGVSMIQPLLFGDLSMVLETGDDQIKGVLSDSGGPLSIDGVLTLKDNGTYQLNGSVSARNDNNLQNALRAMGRPGPDGKVKINYSGKLASLGLVPSRPRK